MAMMSLSELNKQARELDPNEVNDPDPSVISPKEQLDLDIRRSLELLTRCSVLMTYMGDPKWVPQLGNRERKAISRQVEEVSDFLEEVIPYYRDGAK